MAQITSRSPGRRAASFPTPFVVPAHGEHEYTIIFLHGRGSNGPEFQQELTEERTSAGETLMGSQSSTCKWIFPSAPNRYSTRFKEELNEWFDTYSLEEPDAEWSSQTAGLQESVQHVLDIIVAESQSLPLSHIILGGISQGFAVASHVLTSLPAPIAGFIGLSGWMPVKALPIDESKIVSRSTPVFVSHSKGDSIVDVGHGEAAAARLQKLGFTVEVHIYDNDRHWISEPEGYDHLAAFLRRCLE